MIELIERLKGTYSVRELCKLFEINRSTIYDRRERSNEPEGKDEGLVAEIIRACLKHKAYGYKRITVVVRRKGYDVGKNKVYAIMKSLGLLRKKKKKWIKTTDSNHANSVFPNLAPKLKVTTVNQLWVGDITFVSIGNGKFVYVATLMDIFSRKVLGWHVSTNIDTQLCLDVLNIALRTRSGSPIEGLVHHTDRGVQYTSKEYRKALSDNSIIGSMSRKGNTEVCILLIEKNAEVNAKDDVDLTPLYSAAGKGCAVVCRLLIKKGAEVNAKDNERGRTPLYEAVVFSSAKVCRLLIENRAKMNASR